MKSRGVSPLHSPIDATLLSRPVDGQRIPAGATLGNVLSSNEDAAALLVFLRHHG